MSVDVQAVAKALNLTPRRVQQLKAEGLPSVGRGQYELGPCMAWYIRYLQSVLERRGPNGNADTPDLIAEKTRLAREQGDKLEIDNAVKRGELVYASEVATAWSNHIADARVKLLGLPSKVAPQLINQDNANAIAARIRDEITAALTELAEGSEDSEDFDSDGEGAPDMDAAAESDDLAVGGSIQKAV